MSAMARMFNTPKSLYNLYMRTRSLQRSRKSRKSADRNVARSGAALVADSELKQ